MSPKTEGGAEEAGLEVKRRDRSTWRIAHAAGKQSALLVVHSDPRTCASDPQASAVHALKRRSRITSRPPARATRRRPWNRVSLYALCRQDSALGVGGAGEGCSSGGRSSGAMRRRKWSSLVARAADCLDWPA